VLVLVLDLAPALREGKDRGREASMNPSDERRMATPAPPFPPLRPVPPGATGVEIPRIPEHSKLFRFFQHPFLYVVLFALWFACEQGQWLPSPHVANGKSESEIEEAGEVSPAPAKQPSRGVTDLLRELFPESQSGDTGRVTLAKAMLTVAPMLLGIALLLVYLLLRACHVQVLPEGRFRPASWDTWHLARCAVVFLLFYRVASADLAAIQYLRQPGTVWSRIPDFVIVVLSTNVLFLAMCAFIFLLVTLGGGHPLRALGLWEPRPVSRALAGVVAFLTALPLIALAAIVMRLFWLSLGRTPRLQAVLEAASRMPTTAYIVVVFGGVVVASVTEEILFRGFLYATLRRYAGAFGSIVVSGAVFATLHEPMAFLPIFVIGCLLAWLYERTGTLLAPIGAHAANNLYTFLLVYIHYR
jgi:uncharacterized protein